MLVTAPIHSCRPRHAEGCYIAGFEDILLLVLDQKLERRQLQYPSVMPCRPTVAAFQKLMSISLHEDWGLLAYLALCFASVYEQEAVSGVRAALTDARKAKLDTVQMADVPAGHLPYGEFLEKLYGAWQTIHEAETVVSLSPLELPPGHVT